MRRDVDDNGSLEEYFYHADDQFNIVAVTDASGAVVERYEYGPFGEPTILDPSGAQRDESAIGNANLWNGREYDAETGLYYYRLRYLDPELGRFTTLDPIGLWGDPNNLGNGYAYVGNRPWTGLDPYGLQPSFTLPAEVGQAHVAYWSSNDYLGPRLTGQALDGFTTGATLGIFDGPFVGDPYYGQFDNLSYTIGSVGGEALTGFGVGKMLGTLGRRAFALIPESKINALREMLTSKGKATGGSATHCVVEGAEKAVKAVDKTAGSEYLDDALRMAEESLDWIPDLSNPYTKQNFDNLLKYEDILSYGDRAGNLEVPGGLAGAIRLEKLTGLPIRGSWHIQKGTEVRRGLGKLRRAVENAFSISDVDRAQLLSRIDNHLGALDDALR